MLWCKDKAGKPEELTGSCLKSIYKALFKQLPVNRIHPFVSAGWESKLQWSRQ